MPSSDGPLPGTVAVPTKQLKLMLHVLEQATKMIYHNGSIHLGDKRMLFGKLKVCKEILRDNLQLDLFTPAQRVR